MPRRQNNRRLPPEDPSAQLNEEDPTEAGDRAFIPATDEVEEKGVGAGKVRNFLNFEVF
jgi:hypothetical protein